MCTEHPDTPGSESWLYPWDTGLTPASSGSSLQGGDINTSTCLKGLVKELNEVTFHLICKALAGGPGTQVVSKQGQWWSFLSLLSWVMQFQCP